MLAALAELQRITGGSSGAIAIDRVEHVYAQLSATMPIARIDEPAPVIRWASLFDGRESTVLPFRHSLEKDELDRAPRGLTLVLSELQVNLFMRVSAKRSC